jgi:2-polyprenyl-3-methyl-5-hydroxy-6-metoxy-1,4-benzoquinol methylase
MLRGTMSELETPRWTWNRYARPVVRPPDSLAEQQRYRQSQDRNPERTPLDPRAEGPLEHLSRYLRALPLIAGRRVLDAGCGHGYGALLLGKAGAATVTAVDIAPRALRAAQALAAAEETGAGRVWYAGGDLGRLPLRDGSVDLIVALEVLEHLADPAAFMREAARLLAAGGCLLLSTPNRELISPGWQIPPNCHHVREYTPAELRALLARHFQEIELQGQIPGPALLRRRREGRAGRRIAVALERAIGIDPRRWIPAPLRARLRGPAPRNAGPRREPRAEAAALPARIRLWIETGLRAPGPELNGLYSYGAAEDGEQLLATCRRPHTR